jgi:hypothetical protein
MVEELDAEDCAGGRKAARERIAMTNTSRSVSPIYWASIGAARAGERKFDRSASRTPGSRTRAIRKPGIVYPARRTVGPSVRRLVQGGGTAAWGNLACSR